MVTSAPKPPASARVGSTTDPAGSPAPTAPAPTSVGPGHEWSIPAVATPDQAAAAAARALHDELAKPPGSLGRLEDLAVQLAAISGICPPPVPDRPAVAVFAGDHGVVTAGVTPWPSEVTASMLTTVATGGAAVNALAQVAGASVTAVAVGVATPWVPSSRILDRTVRAGTDDLAEGPAMSVVEARRV